MANLSNRPCNAVSIPAYGRSAAFGRVLFQQPAFFVGVEPGTGQEAHAFRGLQRETAAASLDHINDQVGVLPIFELGDADIEGAIGYLAQIDIAVADLEFMDGITHGRATVAATARLMKEQGPVRRLEPVDQADRVLGHGDTFYVHWPLLAG